MGEQIVNCDEILYLSLRDSKAVFDLVEFSGEERKDVWVLSYSLEKRILVLSDGPVKLQDVARLNFKGKGAVKFFKEVLPKLPETVELRVFENKPFYVYPYASPPEKWFLVRACPYFFVFHRSKTLGDRKKRFRKSKKGLKRLHEYSVIYKLSLSLIKPFFPLKEGVVSEGEPLAPHEAGGWRKEVKEITKFILDEFKERKTNKLPVVLALKDGKEVRGVLKRRNLGGFYYVLLNAEDLREKIFIFKHAVDDFWIED
jgi:sRNA-binding regulator protein Hfq